MLGRQASTTLGQIWGKATSALEQHPSSNFVDMAGRSNLAPTITVRMSDSPIEYLHLSNS